MTLIPLADLQDLERDAALVGPILRSLDTGIVGICLCDERDVVRYANATFRDIFFGGLVNEQIDFVDALMRAIAVKRGIKVASLSPEAFAERIRKLRRAAGAHRRFPVDLSDGSWWWVNDHKLANNWMLVVTAEITSVKDEEFRLRHAHAAAVKAAQTDFLTGLANRRHGFEEAEAILESGRQNRMPVALALLDIDHFKRINDVYGHDIGDEVLVHFATVLTEGLGATDQVSRIGGEEFLVVLPGASVTRAQLRLQPILRSMPPLLLTDRREPLHFTVSAGIALAHSSETLREVLHRADVALYSAKTKGRHRIEVCASNRDAASRGPDGFETDRTPQPAEDSQSDRFDAGPRPDWR